jgi:hypothetical protein
MVFARPSLSSRRRAVRLKNPSLAVIAAVVGLVTAVVALAPGGGPEPGARGTAAPVAPVTAARRHGPRSATTTTAAALAVLAPTTGSPLPVLEIGDSLGIDLGDQLQSELDATGLARTTMASVGDSGLANAVFYDWPAHLAALLASDHPRVVVIFLGANDDQGLSNDAAATVPGSPAWVAGYTQRVGALLQEATGAGARVLWVGMPPMENPDLDATMALEDTIFEREANRVAGSFYLSSLPVLGDDLGHYESTGVDASGQLATVRTPDGVHLTPDGAAVLAHLVIAAMTTRWAPASGL